MFDQRSPRLKKQEGQYKKWKEAATPQSLIGRQGKGRMFFGCRPLPRQSVVVKSRQGFSGGFVYFPGLGTTKEPSDQTRDEIFLRHEFQPPAASQNSFRQFCAQDQSTQSASRGGHVSPSNSRVNLSPHRRSARHHHSTKKARQLKPAPACPLFNQNEPLPRLASHGK